MPRKRPLSAPERRVAARLRAARASRGTSQTQFAEAAGLTRARLASYEAGRATLRTDAALALCAAWGINEEWLASGKGEARPSLGFGKDYAGSFRGSFLDTFNTFLKKEVKARRTPAYRRAVRAYRRDAETAMLRKSPAMDIEMFVEEVPDEHLQSFNEDLRKLLSDFAKQKKIDLDPTLKDLIQWRPKKAQQ